MLRQIDDWDYAYLEELAKLNETAEYEVKDSAIFDSKKASCRDEIAKQVCAFSNAGGGFLVFGITKEKKLDGGVPREVGRQSTTDWIEAIIPKLLMPPVTGCQARFVQGAGHATDFAALVLWIPTSESRPHSFTVNGIDATYIRAGAHSSPMSLQTFRDMVFRQSSRELEVVAIRRQDNFQRTCLPWS